MHNNETSDSKGRSILTQLPHHESYLKNSLKKTNAGTSTYLPRATQKTMAELFNVDHSIITKHLKNIYEDEEMNKKMGN